MIAIFSWQLRTRLGTQLRNYIITLKQSAVNSKFPQKAIAVLLKSPVFDKNSVFSAENIDSLRRGWYNIIIKDEVAKPIDAIARC